MRSCDAAVVRCLIEGRPLCIYADVVPIILPVFDSGLVQLCDLSGVRLNPRDACLVLQAAGEAPNPVAVSLGVQPQRLEFEELEYACGLLRGEDVELTDQHLEPLLKVLPFGCVAFVLLFCGFYGVSDWGRSSARGS